MPFILKPPGSPLSLVERVAALARHQRAWNVAAGLASVVGFAAAVLGLLIALDCGFGLPPLALACGLALLLGGTAWLALRCVWPHLTRRRSPLEIALQLEAAHPELNDAVASAVQFHEAPNAGGFRQAAIEYAEQRSRQFELEAILPIGRFWRCAAAAAFAVVLLLITAAANRGVLPAAIARLLDPWGGHGWPQQTMIELVDAPERIAQGDPWRLRATLTGVLPAAATLHLRNEAGTFDVSALIEQAGAVQFELDPSRAAADFEYRLEANDAATPWRAVRVEVPPKLVDCEGRASPRIVLHTPAYTRQGENPLPDGAASFETVAGTCIDLRACADRPLAAASIQFAGDGESFAALQAAALLAGTDPLRAACVLTLCNARAAPLPVAVSGDDRRKLSAAFIPAVGGVYALRFTDDTGLTGQRLIDIRTFEDPSPTVTLVRPDPARDALDRRIDLPLPIEILAADRTFGVRAIMLNFQHEGEAWQSLPLADLAHDRHAHAGLAGGSAGDVQLSSATLAAEASLDLARLPHAGGRPPAAGDRLRLRAAATDWDDVTLFKQPGLSAEIELRLHTESSLEAEVQRRLAALREPLRQVVEAQAAAAQATTEAADLDRSAAAQADVRRKLSDPGEGLLARLDDLQALRRENRMQESPAAARMQALRSELARIDDERLPEIESLLAAARQTPAKLPELANAQEQAARGLAAAAAELDRWAGLAELQSEAHDLSRQLRRAGEAASRLQQQLPAGAPPERLSPEQRAALGQLAAQHERAAEQLGMLLDKASRVQAAKEDAGAAGEARQVEQALEAAGGTAAVEELRKAARDLAGNRIADAARRRNDADDRVQAFESAIAGQAEAAETLRRRREQRQELLAIRGEQEELSRKASAARSADERRDLAGEQEQLQRRAEELAERMRAESPPAAEQLRQAAAEMERAAEQLRQGEEPAEAAKRVEDALKQAEAQHDEPPPPAEEPDREAAAEMARAIVAFRDRQRAALEEFDRITAAAQQARGWSRAHAAGLVALAEAQTAFARELREFSAAMGDAPVFERMLALAADASTVAAARLHDRKDDALTATDFDQESDNAANALARQPMREALRRLEQLAAALDDQSQPKKPPMQQPPAEPPPAGAPGGSNAVQPLAQLKVLRDWQADLRERTAEFGKRHPDRFKLTDDQQTELESLHSEQRAIAELFERLRESLTPGPAVLP